MSIEQEIASQPDCWQTAAETPVSGLPERGERVAEHSLVWLLGPAPDGLVDELAATGARVVEPPGDPLAELVRVQRFAVALARERGLDPEKPRNLTRSVVLR